MVGTPGWGVPGSGSFGSITTIGGLDESIFKFVHLLDMLLWWAGEAFKITISSMNSPNGGTSTKLGSNSLLMLSCRPSGLSPCVNVAFEWGALVAGPHLGKGFGRRRMGSATLRKQETVPCVRLAYR